MLFQPKVDFSWEISIRTQFFEISAIFVHDINLIGTKLFHPYIQKMASLIEVYFSPIL